MERLKDKIVERKKFPTWGKILTELDKGQEIVISHENAIYVRSEISRTLKYTHPEMKFSTRKKAEDGEVFLLIKRDN